ncbi:hypothetical protein SAMN05444141_112102 [Pseudovibrio denitrificans]|uniref:Uncharacterized protein n=1 Tax=Pseudovibrio denitrificans TaxID=258256 RepID=A0A1I7DXV4_9HYPH|nr:MULTISPECIES: hypothetical protein [Pseudovibrio]SFU16501.1 hypothetical protein SAMN05444141_112102 [Pseudovibrio denitrificans]
MKYFLVFVFVMFSFSVNADIIRKQVAANRTAKLNVYSYYVPETCGSAELPKVSFVKKPEHGVVRFVQSRSALPSSAGKCAGKVTNDLIMYYSPDKDFRGTDKVVTKFRMYTSGRVISGGNTYEIEIK